MNIDLTNRRLYGEDVPRARAETTRWPNGPACSHRGSLHVALMGGASGPVSLP